MAQIRAKIALSLPNTFYKLVVKYDTFEEATFDSYLVASLIKNSNSKGDAMRYISEITGNGSLNKHFKKLYEEISKFQSEQIDGIVNNSLYPVTVVDAKHHMEYYPMLNATRFNDKVYEGKLVNDYDLISKVVLPARDDIKLLSIESNEEEGVVIKDNYDAIFTETGIQVDLGDGKYFPISNNDFYSVFDFNDSYLDSEWLPKIGTEITDGNWTVLSNEVVSYFGKDRFTYKDNENNLVVLYNDSIKVTEVIKAYGLYFYKDTKYNISKKNAARCEAALNYLMESNKINEYKTRSLINLLYSVSDLLAQKVVIYILSRKNSKEISQFGLELIKNGLEKNWTDSVLSSIKSITPPVDIKYIYRINSNLNYELKDLLNIDDTDLEEIDRLKKQSYLSERKTYLDEISRMIGEITTSGVREKMKKLDKDNEIIALNKFCNEYVGHSKIKFDELDDVSLKNRYNEIKAVYDGRYRKILARCNELNN